MEHRAQEGDEADDDRSSADDGSCQDEFSYPGPDPEFVYVIPPDLTIMYRRAFLDAIEKLAPRVLKALKRGVYRLPRERWTARVGLGSPLNDWAERFNLYSEIPGAGDRIVRAALRTLEHWESLGMTKENWLPDKREGSHAPAGSLPKRRLRPLRNLKWSPNAASVSLDEHGPYTPPLSTAELDRIHEATRTPFSLVILPWNPNSLSEVNYRKLACEQFDRLLSEYIRECVVLWNFNNLRGLVRRGDDPLQIIPCKAPVKRALHQFEWLVDYQINRKSMTWIAEEYHGSERHHQTTSQGIRLVAQLLFGEAWRAWLRPTHKGGQPRKTGKAAN